MQWINGEIQQQFPGKIRIAEGMHKSAWVTKDVGAVSKAIEHRYDSDAVSQSYHP